MECGVGEFRDRDPDQTRGFVQGCVARMRTETNAVMSVRRIVFCLALSASGGCQASLLCGDTVLQEIPSPAGGVVATVVERDCGATTDYATLVDLRRSDRPLDLGNSTLALVLDGRSTIAVEWKTEEHFVVQYTVAEVIRQEPRVEGVRVEVVRRVVLDGTSDARVPALSGHAGVGVRYKVTARRPNRGAAATRCRSLL